MSLRIYQRDAWRVCGALVGGHEPGLQRLESRGHGRSLAAAVDAQRAAGDPDPVNLDPCLGASPTQAMRRGLGGELVEDSAGSSG